MILSYPDLKQFVDGGCITRPDGSPIATDLISIGLHLDSELLWYQRVHEPVVPPADLPTERVTLSANDRYRFVPGAKLLACSLEQVRMPLDVMGFIQTKGSLARGFVMAHFCDGQIDPGFTGKITFELINLSDVTYELHVGIPIAQLFLFRLSQPVERGYVGRYQGADGPTPMRAPIRNGAG